MSDDKEIKIESQSNNSLIFISHDTRDFQIAEAFSKLLSSVSAGVLKSFRSSDKKGKQGIDYGVEWYPDMMSKLENASDVVCLLTPNSINRPWILYEAGVAKGKLDTSVHGLALGISLSKASSGPFAQFQNCDDDEESLTSLVIQLVKRIPNAEPDREIVLRQVQTFKDIIKKCLSEQSTQEEVNEDIDSSSVAKLFEEIKVMFSDLPIRLEHRLSDLKLSNYRTKNRIHPSMLEEMLYMNMKSNKISFFGLLQVFSFFKEDFPLIYDLMFQLYLAEQENNVNRIEVLYSDLISLIENYKRNPIISKMSVDSKEKYYLIRELPIILERYIRRFNRSYKNIDSENNKSNQ